jgi:hypothetical protein
MLTLTPRRRNPSTSRPSSSKVSSKVTLVFKTKGQVTSKAGVRINGVKYIVTTFDEDENAAYMKSDEGGATAIKTAQTILVGTYNSKKNNKQCQGNCNQDVARLAKALRDAGY